MSFYAHIGDVTTILPIGSVYVLPSKSRTNPHEITGVMLTLHGFDEDIRPCGFTPVWLTLDQARSLTNSLLRAIGEPLPNPIGE